MRRRSSSPASSGQALVEFSLAITIFVWLMLGVFDLGRLVYVNTATAQAAREAARWGSVQFRSASDTSRQTIAAYAINTMTAVPSPSASATCMENGAPIADPSTCHAGDLLVVHVTSVVAPITPVIGQLVGNVTVSSSTEVTVQQ